MQQLQTPALRKTGSPEALEAKNQEHEKTESGLHLPLNLEDAKPSILSVLKNLLPGS